MKIKIISELGQSWEASENDNDDGVEIVKSVTDSSHSDQIIHTTHVEDNKC